MLSLPHALVLLGCVACATAPLTEGTGVKPARQRQALAEPAAAELALAALGLEAPAQKEPDKESTPLSETSRFGAPLVVDGQRIPDVEIQRFLCFGLGNKQVELAKFDIIIQQEIDRRRAQGEDVSQLKVDEGEAERNIARQRDDFLLRYPTLDFPTEVARAHLSLDLYKEGARQAQLFDKIFLPENPDQWPALSIEALREGGMGEMWVSDAKTSYQKRKERQLKEGLQDIPADDPIFVDMLRSTVLTALNNFAIVEKDPAKLEAGVLMSVDGVPIKIDAVFEKIAPHVTAELLEDAKRFLALKAMFSADLGKKGVLLTRKEFEETFEGPGDSYQEKLLQHMMLALQVFGLPSMEAYEDYALLMRSYQRSIADKLADDAFLLTHKPAADRIAGAGRVDSQVILLSAYDFVHVQWKENGWADAERRARELKKALDEGANWTDTLQLHSEFWDPPMPEVGQKPQTGFRFKGMFGPQTRPQLLSYLFESEYRMYLHGPSVADFIFFEQQPGTISEPMKGPYGYYISRVLAHNPPSTPLNMAEPRHRDFLVQHTVRHLFHQEAQRLLEEGRATGRLKGL